MQRSTKIKSGVAVLLAVLAAVVIFQNTEAVETRILFVTLTMPRAVLLFFTFLLGALVGMLVTTRLARGRSREERKS